jgi:hypothetical protein
MKNICLVNIDWLVGSVLSNPCQNVFHDVIILYVIL